MKSGGGMAGPGWSGQQLQRVSGEGDDGKPEQVTAKATGDREINERMQGTTELKRRVRRRRLREVQGRQRRSRRRLAPGGPRCPEDGPGQGRSATGD